jgi:hypothetical protein
METQGTPIDQLRNPMMNTRQPRQLNNDVGYDDINYTGDDMDNLRRDVTDTLDGITIQQDPYQSQQPQQSQQRRPQKQIMQQMPSQPQHAGIMSKVPEMFREPLLIVIIYIIMSNDAVRKVLSSYIPQIKCNADGSIFFMGYVIYGIILAIIFTITKKVLL